MPRTNPLAQLRSFGSKRSGARLSAIHSRQPTGEMVIVAARRVSEWSHNHALVNRLSETMEQVGADLFELASDNDCRERGSGSILEQAIEYYDAKKDFDRSTGMIGSKVTQPTVSPLKGQSGPSSDPIGAIIITVAFLLDGLRWYLEKKKNVRANN